MLQNLLGAAQQAIVQQQQRNEKTAAGDHADGDIGKEPLQGEKPLPIRLDPGDVPDIGIGRKPRQLGVDRLQYI
ncbi:hypothetical protein D3C87_2056700 [compost metagenome]